MAAPFVSAVKQRYPAASVTMLVLPAYKEIAACMKGVDQVIEYNDKSVCWLRAIKKKYYSYWDLGFIVFVPILIPLFYALGVIKIISFPDPSGHNNHLITLPRLLPPSVDNISLMMLRVLDGEGIQWSLHPPYFIFPELQLPCDLDMKNYIVIHPGTLKKIKLWPVERYAALADTLIRKGYTVVFTGVSREKVFTTKIIDCMSESHYVDLTGKTTLVSLGNILQYAQFVIGPDTGALHLARALGVYNVMLLGPSQPEMFKPTGVLHNMEKSKVATATAVTCRKKTTAFGYAIPGVANCYQDACPTGDYACMTSIMVDAVLSVTNEFEQMRKTT